MFLHPSILLFWSVLVISITIIISSASWLLTWIFIEVNLIVFIPIIINNHSNLQIEASLNYFLTQAIGSILILISIFIIENDNLLSPTLLLTAFILNIGAAPLHQWLVSILPGITWQTIFIFSVPQNIAPLLLTETVYSSNLFYPITVYCILSGAVGSFGGLIFSSINNIIAYSSIANISWLLVSLIISSLTWNIYFTVYSAILLSVIASLDNLNLNNLNDIFFNNNNNLNTLVSINILSLAGLPPFSGFFINIFVLNSCTSHNINIIFFLLLLVSLVSLFFYTRVIIASLFWTSHNNNLFNHNNTESMWLIFFNMAALLVPGPLILFLYS